jgi:hypothetical protein
MCPALITPRIVETKTQGRSADLLKINNFHDFSMISL